MVFVLLKRVLISLLCLWVHFESGIIKRLYCASKFNPIFINEGFMSHKEYSFISYLHVESAMINYCLKQIPMRQGHIISDVKLKVSWYLFLNNSPELISLVISPKHKIQIIYGIADRFLGFQFLELLDSHFLQAESWFWRKSLTHQTRYLRVLLKSHLAELMLKLSVHDFNYTGNALDFDYCLNVGKLCRLKYGPDVTDIDALRLHDLAKTLGVVGNILQVIQIFDKLIQRNKLKMLSSLRDYNILFLALLILNWVEQTTPNQSGFFEVMINVAVNELRPEPDCWLVNVIF